MEPLEGGKERRVRLEPLEGGAFLLEFLSVARRYFFLELVLPISEVPLTLGPMYNCIYKKENIKKVKYCKMNI